MEILKYLGRSLDQTDDDWMAVRQNIMRASLVWGRMGTLLRQEGAYPKVLAMFYRAVAQAILLYCLDTLVLLEAMEKKVEGSHTAFLRHIMGK